jgi:hypothetical protein
VQITNATGAGGGQFTVVINPNNVLDGASNLGATVLVTR